MASRAAPVLCLGSNRSSDILLLIVIQRVVLLLLSLVAICHRKLWDSRENFQPSCLLFPWLSFLTRLTFFGLFWAVPNQIDRPNSNSNPNQRPGDSLRFDFGPSRITRREKDGEKNGLTLHLFALDLLRLSIWRVGASQLDGFGFGFG